MLKFSPGYFVFALAIFVTEVGIALFVDDLFIRPYFGDTLVVILIYCFLKSFAKLPVIATAVAVLLFSYLVEITQYFNLVGLLGLDHSRTATVVMGNSFEWFDFVAYTVGILIVLAVEQWRREKIATAPEAKPN